MKQRKKLKAMERKRDTEERKRNKYKSNNQITCEKMEITLLMDTKTVFGRKVWKIKY